MFSRFIFITMLKFPAPHEKILPADIRTVRPPNQPQDHPIVDRIRGSLVGLAVGDALGASVEFRPRQYLVEHPVSDMMSGGTWGLRAGQWTDDTSMALCLASSLISQKGYNSYDQMVRYKWWYRDGYLSSTGQCFDIGNATRTSLDEFYRRQNRLKRDFNLQTDLEVDQLSSALIQQVQFDVNCSQSGVAGNGALMRLAPVPLFFYRTPSTAVELSGQSARLTHGDDVAVDACRYYGALIVAAVTGESKETLLSNHFYENHSHWFGPQALHNDILRIASGSYKRQGGYEEGIRGKGHIVLALEAALWAFWSADSFDEGVLKAVNLGDDADTTAAIYGQLAGAHYGYDNILPTWINKLYACDLIVCIADWLQFLDHPENKLPEQQRASRRGISRVVQSQPHSPIVKKPERSSHGNRAKSSPRRSHFRVFTKGNTIPKSTDV
jgi:ADP-ribosyl-[dinitrogen reductase] hydrolase